MTDSKVAGTPTNYWPFWRPRSLYQVALLGFLVIWIPLVGAIAYSGYRFDEQAIRGNELAERLVLLTRGNQQLQTATLELERRAGQFLVLRDEDLARLYSEEHQRLQTMVAELQQQLPKEANFQLMAIADLLEKLKLGVLAPEKLFDAGNLRKLFDQLQTALDDFSQNSAAMVDQQLSQAVGDAANNREMLIVMTLLLSLISLIAAGFFIISINRPVRQLEREIRRLGGGDLQQSIQINGPEEMKRLSQQLDWLRVRLAEIDAQKQQFLRLMSHELKTPLASLREGADLMAEEVTGPLQPQQQEIVAIIRQNSIELQRLIENLLDYNQMLQQHQLSLVEIDLGALFSELLRRYEITIGRKSLQVELHNEVKEPVFLDRNKLRTIVDNMLSNAVNYSPVDEKIWIQARIQDHQLQVSVANQGAAIAEAEAELIFEAFYQGSQIRQGAIKGSGIGLAVAKECAQVHGGELSLVELPGYAVCFRMQLPLSM